MAYREVTMIELKEVLRQWLAAVPNKRIAARLGLDPKTSRRYIEAGKGAGLAPGQPTEVLTDELLTKLYTALRPAPERAHGDAWAVCEAQRAFIKARLDQRIRLTKILKLLLRQGVAVPYSTLHRFAVEQLGFGRQAPTVPVADGEPGKELQVDTGWVGWLFQPDGTKRRFRAWIFTPHRSRHRFVYPCFAESTETAIEACEAAWAYYGGVFHVLVPDNTKAIVDEPDPLEPKLTLGFLEYAQDRDFHVDPARVRTPTDKPRVERCVRDTRDDCFDGETLATLAEAREHARRWYADDYGMRRHSTTGRMPREHFESEERPCLHAAPEAPYDVPEWGQPKIGRDHLAQVARGLYSLPTRFIGERLVSRADSRTVRFYKAGLVVKVHARVGPGEKSIDTNDFPAHQTAYAMRDVVYLAQQADTHGEHVGQYARALLAGPLPWARMRHVGALLGMARKYGDVRLNQTCAAAIAADLVNIRRLQRMLEAALQLESAPPTPPPNVIPMSRYLRPTREYALSPAPSARAVPQGDDHE
ncbi:MAG: IS21 family transposase [Chloroflexota bacterium]